MRYKSYTDKNLITFSDIQQMPGYEESRVISHRREVPTIVRKTAEVITTKGIENNTEPYAN